MGSFQERPLYRSEFLSSPALSPSPSARIPSSFLLTYHRLRRIIAIVFAPLPITNHVSLPVFRILLPVPVTRRHQLFRGLRDDDDDGALAKMGRKQQATYSTPTTLFALVMTVVLIFFLVFFILLLFHLNLYTIITRAYSANRSTLGTATQEDLARVWLWEIASGRYPSRRRVGRSLQAKDHHSVENPAVPPRIDEAILAAKEHAAAEGRAARERGWKDTFRRTATPPTIVPVGPARNYISLARSPLAVLREDDDHPRTTAQPVHQYPPRPILGSALDLDGVLQYCEYPYNYVRDCLEVLRLNAGLDFGFRPSPPMSLSITYLPTQPRVQRPDHTSVASLSDLPPLTILLTDSPNFPAFLSARTQLSLTPPALHPPRHSTHLTADAACDPDSPRIFHVFWTGPFTDKPYLLALSFLYTQPLSLSPHSKNPNLCRPQLWIWINPGPASVRSDEHAKDKMLRDLDQNEWARPLLNQRFKDAIKFKLWDTSAQLDAVEEMKGWRKMRLFNSGGVSYGKDQADPRDDEPSPANETLSVAPPLPKKPAGELFERVGSVSYEAYDRLSVVLSDMARFVLTHRFGGVYLDADTIFLRDWEELWGWKGAFAYRWSRLRKYNTAVLKMSRGSALGNFIFRAAVGNSLDFHPMTVSRYMKDAGMEDLLLMMPDALFDSAWLNTEDYQRDRPPFPYFEKFEELFETPLKGSATPNMLGFDGFFRGAFSYHYHNCWWLPFDPDRNFPELGSRFGHGAPGQIRARVEVEGGQAASKKKKAAQVKKKAGSSEALASQAGLIPGDARDISWASMLKRTFEQFIRGERPNMYGEWLSWEDESVENEKGGEEEDGLMKVSFLDE